MVKKCFFISLLVMVGLTQKVDAEDREAEVQLKTAIGAQCVEEVQRLLKNGLVTEKNKKEFVDAARKELDLLKQNSSVLRNVKDAPYVLGGGLLLAGCGIAIRYGIRTVRSAWEAIEYVNQNPQLSSDDELHAARRSKNKALGIVTVAGVAGLVAGYLGKKGLCGEARDRCLKNAQTIVQLLEKVS